MSITTDSIDKAARLNQIGFPEFTAKLITDVFNAIVSANISQQQSYIQLVQQVSKSLTDYVNDTKDDISGTDILNVLVRVAPDMNAQSGTVINKDSTKTLTADQANKINTAVSIPNTAINTNVANTTSQIKDLYKPITDAIANRISADKYTLLQEMVKLGMVRLVVNNGEIATSLNFEAKDSTFYSRNASQYNSEGFSFNSTVGSGWLTSLWLQASASTSYSKMAVSTLSTSQVATSSSIAQIMGTVKLNFSTDYQPLNQLSQ